MSSALFSPPTPCPLPQPLGVHAVFNPNDLYDRSSPSSSAASSMKNVSRGEGPDARTCVASEIGLESMSNCRGMGGVMAAVVDGGVGEGDRAGGGNSSGHETWITLERLAVSLEGASRPLFFRGIATVVAKLWNITMPHVSVFGKKDYQQWRVLTKLVSSWSGLRA